MPCLEAMIEAFAKDAAKAYTEAVQQDGYDAVNVEFYIRKAAENIVAYIASQEGI